MRDRSVAGAEKRSPLYTSPAARVAKAIFIREHGRDSDGAYRAQNRIDKAGQKKAS